MTDDALPLDLGDGLVLRTATPADADALAAFNAETHGDVPGQPDHAVGVWTRDLLLRPHPTFRPELFTIVEERATGRIVSSLNLIPQTWAFGGVEFGVGRIELVGTHPDFRRRGLVRRQMDLVHRWSAERGHLLQGITGIHWYYRQYGYEMALDLDAHRRVAPTSIPTLPAGETEPYRLRPATPADLPFIAETDAHGRARSLVSCVRDEVLWRHELDGQSEGSAVRVALLVIETVDGGGGEPARPVGFVVHAAALWQGGLWILGCELTPGASWLALAPGLMRGLQMIGDDLATRPVSDAGPGDGQPAPRLDRIVLDLGADHPLYRALPERAREATPPYAWYVRVPDLPAFVRRVAPVLEARLADSPAAGYSGELRLSFYRDGLRLVFAAGRLTAAEPWPRPDRAEAGTTFPPLTFLHLLLGHRSLAELEHAFADCRARSEEARVLLDALFPKLPSHVSPVS